MLWCPFYCLVDMVDRRRGQYQNMAGRGWVIMTGEASYARTAGDAMVLATRTKSSARNISSGVLCIYVYTSSLNVRPRMNVPRPKRRETLGQGILSRNTDVVLAA
jgi:hypothetical protein